MGGTEAKEVRPAAKLARSGQPLLTTVQAAEVAIMKKICFDC